jgi:hypothetical protein
MPPQDAVHPASWKSWQAWLHYSTGCFENLASRQAQARPKRSRGTEHRPRLISAEDSSLCTCISLFISKTLSGRSWSGGNGVHLDHRHASFFGLFARKARYRSKCNRLLSRLRWEEVPFGSSWRSAMVARAWMDSAGRTRVC